VQQRLPSLLQRPITFAHRGARAHARENTIDAFRLALRLGATGLESDVWLTADGIAVLDHDGQARVGRRRRAIATCRRDDLPEHIPELLDLVGLIEDRDVHVSLDLKNAEVGTAVLDLVRVRAPALLPRLWLCHQDLAVLESLRAADESVRLIDSTRLSRLKEGPERRAATLAGLGIDGINLHHSDWTGGLTTLFHRFRRVGFAWDLQFEHVLRPVLRMGVDGVYSDHVDVMVDAYRTELGDG
jgi:glycerophosphoryl diester phosphodiesterase